MLSNYGAGEDSWESLGLQGDQIIQSQRKSTLNTPIERNDGEAEAPILWPPDAKGQLTGKDPDAEKDWGQEKGMTEDEMVESVMPSNHHRFNWSESEQTPGDSEGQGKPGV